MVAPMRMSVPFSTCGQEGVLLALVEAVDLVHEEDGALAAARAVGLGLGHDLADLLDAGQHGREGHEARARRPAP